MELQINDSRTIAEVQADFNRQFPFLKIEFFQNPCYLKAAFARSAIYNSSNKIAACGKKHNSGTINLSGKETVLQLEKNFWESFGLSIQVFRKSGTVWIETTLTDGWALDRQNSEGFELSSYKNSQGNNEAQDQVDHRE